MYVVHGLLIPFKAKNMPVYRKIGGKGEKNYQLCGAIFSF
jgi:hypothetical protein